MTESLPEGASFGGRDENRDGGSWNGYDARMARITRELAARRQQREQREQAGNSMTEPQREDGPAGRTVRRNMEGQPHPKIRRIDDAMQLEGQQQDAVSRDQGDTTMHTGEQATPTENPAGTGARWVNEAAMCDVDAEDDSHTAILRDHCDNVAQEALAVMDGKLPQGVQFAATVRYFSTQGGLCQRCCARRTDSAGLGQGLCDAGATSAQQ